jgi:hypothetical protein
MSGFRFLNVFMSKFLFFFLFSWRSFGLAGIYKIGIGVFFHAGKLAGAISWTPICNYDQGWECMNFTLPMYSYNISLCGP